MQRINSTLASPESKPIASLEPQSLPPLDTAQVIPAPVDEAELKAYVEVYVEKTFPFVFANVNNLDLP